MADNIRQIRIARDTDANWDAGRVPAAGEPVYETNTKLFRVGDGSRRVKDLDAAAFVDGATGLLAPRIMDAIRSELGTGAAQNVTRLATFGDSMTARGQEGYAAYGSLVADYLGMALFNPSVAGERTSDISVRQGGFAPRFTVPGGVIPIDTSEFPVTLAETYTNGFSPAATTKGNIGTFLNVSFLGTPVNLYHVNNAWTMARVAPAVGANPQPTVVPKTGAVVRDISASSWRDAVQVYMGGFNGGDQVRDVAMMAAFLAVPDRFIVLGIATGASGGDPTPPRAINAALAAAYPNQFFDMSAYVISNGLADEGITPTSQDTADMAAGIVPVSLRRGLNDPHYNALGQRVIARRLAELIIERGFVVSSSSHRIPPRPARTKLSLPNSRSGARVAANSALQAADSVSVRLLNLGIPSVTSGSAAYRNLASRWGGGSDSWQLLLQGDGKLFLQDANGTAASAVISTSSGKISVRMDINRMAGTAAFFTSTDAGATWNPSGSAATGRSTANPISGKTGPLYIGWNGSYGPEPGTTLDRITILDASGATLEDHDFTVPDTEGWVYEGDAGVVNA